MPLKTHGTYIAAHSKIKIPLASSLLSAGDAFEISDDYELLDINELVTNGREGFVSYTVTGESMCDEIRPGYIVFVDPYLQPKIGDIIVARVNNKNNIKMFYPSQTGLYLVPKNLNFPLQEITANDEFSILGVVKAHLAVYK